MRYKLTNWKTFLMAAVFLLALATVFEGPSVSASAHSVTKITFSPPTPNILLHNQRVTLTFSYATTQPGGVRIFARPFTGGAPSPNYAASPSGISPSGSGTGSQWFTISSGNVTVDQVRIQMWNAAQTTLLFEAFLPVHYQFRAP
jgi:hypothetical protein